jgi:hypothetical protein
VRLSARSGFAMGAWCWPGKCEGLPLQKKWQWSGASVRVPHPGAGQAYQPLLLLCASASVMFGHWELRVTIDAGMGKPGPYGPLCVDRCMARSKWSTAGWVPVYPYMGMA